MLANWCDIYFSLIKLFSGGVVGVWKSFGFLMTWVPYCFVFVYYWKFYIKHFSPYLISLRYEHS